ncbi:MAG TPA: hypothetical protein VGQ46_11015 [Thermoanaerobaculia bacterium]|jgi:hypothetical protein|nr:hypothetical protein [Thermoanaerobaculia bacterium]
MRTALKVAALLLAAACATNSAAPGPEPDINIYQISRVAVGTEHDTGPVSAQFAVEVKNKLTEPLSLRRVALQSIGGGAYTLRPYSQAFNETIAPGQTKRVAFWAPAFVTMDTMGGANGPVTLRASLDFEAGGKKFQKVEVQNVGTMGD